MDRVPDKTPDLQHVTTSAALSLSSPGHGGGQGAGAAPPPPKFNLPDSYWLPRQDRTDLLHLKQADTTKLVARYLAACDDSKSSIAARFEKLEADRENDPRSRTEGRMLQASMIQFQPARFELSADTIAGLIVLNDPEGDISQSPAETRPEATVTQQDAAASGCCIPPSCTIL